MIGANVPTEFEFHKGWTGWRSDLDILRRTHVKRNTHENLIDLEP